MAPTNKRLAPPLRLALLSLLTAVVPSHAAPAEAEAALHGEFTLQGVTAAQPRLPSGGYDWDWRGPRDDPEWAWFFNRHGWFPSLLEAYRETGDDRYSRAILDTLDDWIATHPAPGRITFSAAWRPLEAARRLTGSWLVVMPALADSPGFTAERRARYRACLAAHGDHLRNHHAFGGNHLVTEMLALVQLALAEPALPGAEDWLRYGLDQLSRAYADQVYPDGAHKELSTHYQRVIALNYQQLLDLLRTHGQDTLAADWIPRVERLWYYIAAVRQPDGTNPINNDSDREHYSQLLASHASHVMDRVLPAHTHFPWAGQTVFRAGEHWAFFDAGPRGTDHDHADLLHFSLSLGHRHFLVDNGRYTYAPGPWRDYFAGPAGHNVLLLDGQGADAGPRAVAAPPSPARYHAAGPFTIAWGDAVFARASSRRDGDWRRIVIYAQDAGWVVVDRIIAFGHRELSTLWHWDPSVTAAEDVGGRLGMRAGDARLDVALASSTTGQWTFIRGAEPPAPVQGWFSPAFNRREPALCTIHTQPLAGPLLNVWLFRPAGSALEATVQAGGRVLVVAGEARLTLDPGNPASAVWIR